MPDQKDLWRAAWIIAEQYGPEGVAFAAQMAQSFEIGGKDRELRAWRSIAEKVQELTNGSGFDREIAQ